MGRQPTAYRHRWSRIASTSSVVSCATEEDEGRAGSELREQVRVIEHWYKHDWIQLDGKVRTSIVKGISVFPSLEDRGMDAYVALGREGKAVVNVDPEEYPARARMREKMASEDGRRRYARRKWLSEAPNGWIKEAMGFRRFSFRGLEKVRAEWTLVCLALNVKRLHGLKAA